MPQTAAALAFAVGPHLCLGARLARLEGQLAVGGIVAAFECIELAGEPERRPNLYTRGLEALPIVGRAA